MCVNKFFEVNITETVEHALTQSWTLSCSQKLKLFSNQNEYVLMLEDDNDSILRFSINSDDEVHFQYVSSWNTQFSVNQKNRMIRMIKDPTQLEEDE